MQGDASQRIFLVDDSEDILQSLEMLLSDRIPGLRVETFKEARPALERASTDPPALVVTDYFMPDMDGLEFAERLLSAQPTLPVVIISGYLDDKLSARIRRLPNIKATQHKPLKLAEFVAAVRKLVQA